MKSPARPTFLAMNSCLPVSLFLARQTRSAGGVVKRGRTRGSEKAEAAFAGLQRLWQAARSLSGTGRDRSALLAQLLLSAGE